MTKQRTYLHYALALSITMLFSTAISVKGVERRDYAMNNNTMHRKKTRDHIRKFFPKECEQGLACIIDPDQKTNITAIVKLVTDGWPHIYLLDQEKSIKIERYKFEYNPKTTNLSQGNGFFIIVAPTKQDLDNRFVIKSENNPKATPPEYAAEYKGNCKIKLKREGKFLRVYDEYNKQIAEFTCTTVHPETEQSQPQSQQQQSQLGMTEAEQFAWALQESIHTDAECEKNRIQQLKQSQPQSSHTPQLSSYQSQSPYGQNPSLYGQQPQPQQQPSYQPPQPQPQSYQSYQNPQSYQLYQPPQPQQQPPYHQPPQSNQSQLSSYSLNNPQSSNQSNQSQLSSYGQNPKNPLYQQSSYGQQQYQPLQSQSKQVSYQKPQNMQQKIETILQEFKLIDEKLDYLREARVGMDPIDFKNELNDTKERIDKIKGEIGKNELLELIAKLNKAQNMK